MLMKLISNSNQSLHFQLSASHSQHSLTIFHIPKTMEPHRRAFNVILNATKIPNSANIGSRTRCSRNLTMDCKFHRYLHSYSHSQNWEAEEKTSNNKLLKTMAQKSSPHIKEKEQRGLVRPDNTKTLMAKQAEKQELDRCISPCSALEATAVFLLRL